MNEATKRRRWTQSLRIILIGSLVALTASAAYVAHTMIEAQRLIERMAAYTPTFVVGMGAIEFFRFKEAIADYGLSPDNQKMDDIKLRAEILDGRIDILRSREIGGLVEAWPDAVIVVAELERALAEIGPLVERLEEAGVPARILARLDPLDSQLSRLATIAHQYEAMRGTDDQRRLVSSSVILSGIFASGFLIALLLIAQLAIQNRQITRARDELASMSDDLRQKQKMEVLGQLTGGIAHDFNNLLLAIRLSLDEIADSGAERPDIAPALEIAQGATDQAETLTAQLLAFSRRQTLHPTVIDTNEVVRGVALMLSRVLPANISIETRFGRAVPAAIVDRNQLENALFNLAINARDAMPDGGKIYLHTAGASIDAAVGELAPGDYAMIIVGDTGIGMAPAVAKRALEPFFTTKEPGKGTGLGLAQVYGFITQSGGGIMLDSTPGAGTTVRLYLKIAPDEEWVPAGSPKREPQIVGGRETILVVEDNPVVSRAVLRMLASLGYDTCIATTGDEALEILNGDRRLDLLFTDVMLPGSLNGARLAIEARRRRPDLPILMTTGYADQVMPAAGLGDDFPMLNKPYQKADLAAKLRALLDPAGRALRQAQARLRGRADAPSQTIP